MRGDQYARPEQESKIQTNQEHKHLNYSKESG